MIEISLSPLQQRQLMLALSFRLLQQESKPTIDHQVIKAIKELIADVDSARMRRSEK